MLSSMFRHFRRIEPNEWKAFTGIMKKIKP
jgi:hypothetical protein